MCSWQLTSSSEYFLFFWDNKFGCNLISKKPSNILDRFIPWRLIDVALIALSYKNLMYISSNNLYLFIYLQVMIFSQIRNRFYFCQIYFNNSISSLCHQVRFRLSHLLWKPIIGTWLLSWQIDWKWTHFNYLFVPLWGGPTSHFLLQFSLYQLALEQMILTYVVLFFRYIFPPFPLCWRD